MSFVFLHTADWQLGRPFASVADNAKRHRLQHQRLQTIREISRQIEETHAEIVLVAGDLFDSPHVTKDIVSGACGAIGSWKIPVLVIPGNHDHGGPGSIWEQEFFLREQRQLAPNLHVLTTPEPVILDSAVIFPAPLLRRHNPGDPTAWIRDVAVIESLPPHLPRIVLAHGTIQGFGSQSDDDDDGPAATNWIDLSSLPAKEIDYIALGDWHGTKQVASNAWYCGTPEMDRFPKGDSNDPGNLLKVTVSRNQPPIVEIIPTGHLYWKELAFQFSDDASLDRFAAKLDETIGLNGDRHVLHLILDGALGMDASRKLEELLESWHARLARLKLDSRVSIAPSADEIALLTQRADDPLIATVAAELFSRSQGDSEDAAIARQALRELHSALG